MKQKIVIGNPYISEKDNYAYLNAEITVGEYCKTVFFRVNPSFKSALNDEKSDAFVLAILYYAMVNGYAIEWSAPCSEQLIFQLEYYYIPILKKEIPFFQGIDLIGPLTAEPIKTEARGVATAISGGVDSTYSIYKYLHTPFPSEKLTHVLFTDCFVYGFSEQYKKEFYDFYLEEMPKQSAELGLEFIFIGCNIDEYFGIEPFWDKERGLITNYGLFTLKYCALAYALDKLIKVYYFSSGRTAHDFSWISPDTASYDLFSTAMISSGDVQFYSSGSESTRSEKIKEIADWKFAQKHLQVCAMKHDSNCGLCNKCIRTMSELYAFNKLELFSEQFPTENYLANINRRRGYLIWQAKMGHVDEQQLLHEMKQNNIHVSFISYIWAFHYSVKDKLRNIFKDNKFARYVYEKLNLGRFIYGDLYEQYKKL